jgi:dTDP-4-dehydrorhamnose reductase
MAGLELWGGVECTINRVGDSWYDQLEFNGHRERLEDLDLFAAMGIRRLRQPVLWERHCRDDGDWSITDAALERLRRRGVEPILGLIHHGSGPQGTSLIEDGFAEGLAGHAARVATRYPWAQWYTPVNEPLTTARFSGLYGLWYPHGRDAATFARALVNQCRATVLAMQAIRAVNPAAKLVQTEDLGRAQSTRPLAYQADLENERRWLTWDLLCGRVERASPMIEFLVRAGISRAELGWFADNPCPPDIIGINHYITSDRYLDHRVDRYPGITPGGNGRDRYVDVEAVRALDEPQDGWSRCLAEAWQRYGLPLAITEAHLGCTRDEQLRWLAAAWAAASAARARGLDIRGVTAWALLGSRDWNSLLTRRVGHYEPGVFDTRGGRPRPTALARTLRNFASGEDVASHPAADGPGWWSRPERLLYRGPRAIPSRTAPPRWRRQALLITGAGGNLGQAFARICEQRGLEHRLFTRSELDICRQDAIESTLKAMRPWALVNAAGYVRVDEAERDDERCYRENSDGPARLAAACQAYGVRLVTFSSDLVFDGQNCSPYVESSAVAPLNVYGRSKARAERAVLLRNPESLVIRTSSFFGPWHPYDFLPTALRSLSRKECFAAMNDVVVSHTYVPDLADACLDLLIDAEKGIWHLANSGALSWLELARQGARLAGIDASGLEGRPCSAFGLAACRPAFSALATERGLALPPLEDALARYMRDGRAHWRAAA